MQPMRGNQVSIGAIQRKPASRTTEPFMMPVKLKNQVQVGQRPSTLFFESAGKTLVGGSAWEIKMNRPGRVDSVIMSRQEQAAKDHLTAVANKSPKVGSSAMTPAAKSTISATISAVNAGAARVVPGVSGWSLRGY